MAETQTAAQTVAQTAAQTAAQDTTQQVTSTAPVTKVKNPRRVAAGKAIAVGRRQAREEQEKKIAHADAIIANDQLRKAQEEARKAEEVVAQPFEAPAAESQTLTTTQWLSVASIIVSLAAIYYKREEIRGAVAKIKAPAKAPTPNAVAPKRVASGRWINFLIECFILIIYNDCRFPHKSCGCWWCGRDVELLNDKDCPAMGLLHIRDIKDMR